MKIVSALRDHAARHPDAIALRGPRQVISYAELWVAVDGLADELSRRAARVVGLLLDNQPAWVAADLACLRAGVALVPIPTFFSEAQRRHVVSDAGVDTVLTRQPLLFATTEAVEQIAVFDEPLAWLRLAPARPPAGLAEPMTGIAKITYTSGTTGQAKGVKFTPAALDAVCASCAGVLGARPGGRFLALAPLSVLIENLLGLYVSILVRGEYIAMPMAMLGFAGTTQLDAGKALDMIRAVRATHTTCTPQVLSKLIAALERGAPPVPALEFVGVGGAPIARDILERGAELGLPLYHGWHGWGLSEAGAVVTLNTPGRNRIGTVGHPLPHARVRRADDGELWVQGPALYAGYVGEPGAQDEWLATGDLGEFDQDGYLSITGRKTDVIVNSFGRNISPAWVETELLTRPALSQAVVYGEARPHLVAAIVPAPGACAAAVVGAIEEVNRTLPDYARVCRWVVADAPFSLANHQLTQIGTPERDAIWAAYGARLEQLYDGGPE